MLMHPAKNPSGLLALGGFCAARIYKAYFTICPCTPASSDSNSRQAWSSCWASSSLLIFCTAASRASMEQLCPFAVYQKHTSEELLCQTNRQRRSHLLPSPHRDASLTTRLSTSSPNAPYRGTSLPSSPMPAVFPTKRCRHLRVRRISQKLRLFSHGSRRSSVNAEFRSVSLQLRRSFCLPDILLWVQQAGFTRTMPLFAARNRLCSTFAW